MAISNGARSESARSGLESTAVETMRLELARVRARFGVDPTPPLHLFEGAWTSPSGVVEEDEAEFVDALADCMSVGLPLGAAVAFWASGDLARDDYDDPGGDDDGGQGLTSTHST